MKAGLDEILNKLKNDPEFLLESLLVDIGEEISKFMDLRGFSNADLAKALGVHRSRITRILNGSPNLTVKSLVGIAVALGAKIKTLEFVPIEASAAAEAAPVGPRPTNLFTRNLWPELQEGNLIGADAKVSSSFEAMTQGAEISENFVLHRTRALIGKECPAPKRLHTFDRVSAA